MHEFLKISEILAHLAYTFLASVSACNCCVLLIVQLSEPVGAKHRKVTSFGYVCDFIRFLAKELLGAIPEMHRF
jgi:hypothetical protein